MHELELKFCVPSFNQAALSKQIDSKTAQKQRLAAYYFDTNEQLLAQNGVALRIRFEGEQWVQTLKTAGDGVAKRVELNTVLPIRANPDTLTPAELVEQLQLDGDDTLADILGTLMPLEQLKTALQVQYVTDIERTHRVIKRNASRIEVAYDIGTVSHDNTAAHQPDGNQHTVHEVEFELLEGEVQDLIDVAIIWCKRYKLYLSTVTKAQRGTLLLANQRYAAPVKANLSTLELDKNTSQFAFLQQVVNNCLTQILPNASAIAEGSPDGNHVHQLRVGIRRLRTALKVFKNWADIDPNWVTVLKQTFSLLGEYRDKEILLIKTQPMLEKVGAPHVVWTTDVDIMPIDAVRANDFQVILLELIGFTHLPEPDDSKKAKPAVRKKLDKLFTRIANDSERFAELDTDSQHDIRKNLKTLRYISEFAAPLFLEDAGKGKKSSQLNRFLDYLEPAQDVLGEYNDNVVGQYHYQQKSLTDANALFAVGWFAGREAQSAVQAAESLKTVKSAPIFW